MLLSPQSLHHQTWLQSFLHVQQLLPKTTPPVTVSEMLPSFDFVFDLLLFTLVTFTVSARNFVVLSLRAVSFNSYACTFLLNIHWIQYAMANVLVSSTPNCFLILAVDSIYLLTLSLYCRPAYCNAVRFLKVQTEQLGANLVPFPVVDFHTQNVSLP